MQCTLVSIAESSDGPVIWVSLSVKVPFNIDLNSLTFGHIEWHESLVTKLKGRDFRELIFNLDTVLQTIILFLAHIRNSFATPSLRRDVNSLLHIRSESHGVVCA